VVVWRPCGLITLTVPPDINSNDFEVVLEPLDIARAMPALPAHKATVQQHDGRSNPIHIIGNSDAIHRNGKACGHNWTSHLCVAEANFGAVS
jgi:hypothetical protein